MIHARSTFAFPAMLLVATVAPLRAGPAQPDTTDAGAVLREARAAQASFERVRRDHLPWARARPAGECDERIGRFCYWHEVGGDDPWTPPPEPRPVTDARDALLEHLAGAAERVPGDGWIVGQRVRYLVEAERLDTALEVARSCRASPWWCRALAGYVHHRAERFGAAEAAFDEAFAAMETDRRETWTDLTPLLRREARAAWRELGPGARDGFARRFWWIADPLWLVAGNERRSEHFARRVLDRMQEGARSGFDVAWGPDLEEITLRYGWPSGWERVRARTIGLGSTAAASVVGHDPVGARRFAPPFSTVVAPSAHPPDDWLDAERPRSTYAVPYARSFETLPHQLAIFRRDGEAHVVAAWDASDDSLPGDAEVEAGVVVAADPDARPAVARVHSKASAGSVDLVVPWAPAVVSVEAVAGGYGIAARARYGLPLPGPAEERPAISDLLLVDVEDELPATLDDAVGRARGSPAVAPGETIGLFWEIYPPGGGPYEADVSVGLIDEEGGFWHGLKAAFGLGDDAADGVALSWRETIGEAGRHPRAVAVTLPSDLPAGEYALELEVRLPDSRGARTRRALVVEE